MLGANATRFGVFNSSQKKDFTSFNEILKFFRKQCSRPSTVICLIDGATFNLIKFYKQRLRTGFVSYKKHSSAVENSRVNIVLIKFYKQGSRTGLVSYNELLRCCRYILFQHDGLLYRRACYRGKAT